MIKDFRLIDSTILCYLFQVPEVQQADEIADGKHNESDKPSSLDDVHEQSGQTRTEEMKPANNKLHTASTGPVLG